jgi:hypothetical protein
VKQVVTIEKSKKKMITFKTFAKIMGIILSIMGIIFLGVGIYGLAGGTGASFEINGRLVSPQEGGQAFTVIGVIFLTVGLVLDYFGFKMERKKLIVIITKTGSIVLPIIGVIFLGVGIYGLAGGAGVNGQIFTAAGVIILVIGLILNYFGLKMERKKFITLIIIIIIIISALGLYIYIFGVPRPETPPLVYIDGNDYTTPVTWDSITAVAGQTFYNGPHNLTNADTSKVKVSFTLNVYHFNTTTNQWDTWFNGSQWLVRKSYIKNVTLVSAASTMQLFGSGWASQRSVGENTTYTIFVNSTDDTVYFQLQYPKILTNPTVDGETVFSYICIDGDNDNLIDGADKAFNFTNNLNRTPKNELKVYTPATPSSWQFNNTYTWNENTSPSSVPISVTITDDRKNITWAIPFSYIGAQKDKTIGFALQAFSHDWYPTNVAGLNETTPAKYQEVGLVLNPTATFTMQPDTSVIFYIRVQFDTGATGDYRFVYTATAKKAS